MPFGKPKKEAPAVDFGPELEILYEGGVLQGVPNDDSPASMEKFVSSYYRAQELLDWRLLGHSDRVKADVHRCLACNLCAGRCMPDTLVFLPRRQNESAAGSALPDAGVRVDLPGSRTRRPRRYAAVAQG
jgi:hypothetical protein